MELSNATLELLASLDTISKHKLARRNDLGVLVELAAQHNQSIDLGELSFVAKFVSKAFGIMQRIGRDGEGYERVSHEFTETLEKIKTLLTSILYNGSREIKEHFATTYLAMSRESLQRLLLLCNDLAWYKNWLIDHPGHRGDRLP